MCESACMFTCVRTRHRVYLCVCQVSFVVVNARVTYPFLYMLHLLTSHDEGIEFAASDPQAQGLDQRAT